MGPARDDGALRGVWQTAVSWRSQTPVSATHRRMVAEKSSSDVLRVCEHLRSSCYTQFEGGSDERDCACGEGVGREVQGSEMNITGNI